MDYIEVSIKYSTIVVIVLPAVTSGCFNSPWGFDVMTQFSYRGQVQ